MNPAVCQRHGRISAGAASSARRSGFTLLEMIGVVTVMTVLAGILLPVAIKRIDLRTREQEVRNLAVLSNAFTRAVLHNKAVPAVGNWSSAATNFCEMGLADITANSRRFNRIYYSQTNTVYTQGENGLPSRPDKYRAVIVSILGGDPLNPGVNCPDPDSISDTQFQHLWELGDGARPTEHPWHNWNGRGDDVLIQRVDYTPLFHRLILVNRDAVPTGYMIDGSSVLELPALSSGVGAHFLHGTVVGLWSPTGNAITNQYLLKRDISFVFEKGMWRCKIMGVPIDDPFANEFALQAQQFLNATWYTSAFKGANQQGVVTAMYTFMLTYTFWADRYPHFGALATIQQVPEYIILSKLGDANGQLQDFSNRLLGK